MKKAIFPIFGTVIVASLLTACGKGGGGSKVNSNANSNVVATAVVCGPEVVNASNRINQRRTGQAAQGTLNQPIQNATLPNGYATTPLNQMGQPMQGSNLNSNLNAGFGMGMGTGMGLMDIQSDCTLIEQRMMNQNICRNELVNPAVAVDIAIIRNYCRATLGNYNPNTGTLSSQKDLMPNQAEISMLGTSIDEDSIDKLSMNVLDMSRFKTLQNRWAGWSDNAGLYIPVTACSIRSSTNGMGLSAERDSKMVLKDFSITTDNRDMKLLWLIKIGKESVTQFKMSFVSAKNPDVSVRMNCEYKVSDSMVEQLGGVPEPSIGLMNYLFRGISKFEIIK
jgi:hypothetical protein